MLPLFLLSLYFLLTALAVGYALAGQHPPAFVTPLSTLTGFAFALSHAVQRRGWKAALVFLAIVFIVSLTFESIGVATGLIYGRYHYTDKLGPRFLGLVPYLIPVAWYMMMYASLVIADRLTPSAWSGVGRTLTVAAVAGLVMTAWDLVMDPMMVASRHWIWEEGGAYFGIPLQNFFGWWLTTFVSVGCYGWLMRGDTLGPSRFDWLAVVAYLITGLSSILIFLKYNSAISLIGMMAIFPWVIAGLFKIWESSLD
ncbi:MAG: carotenoid biosynthesis protein [Anaerolineales bacterium]|nr:carotenoid biosynthesis protein [Anaerolineales bacterium]MDW8227977.1 carotenoid biosynthesis protein [Anaerolineales bacterium]